MAYVVRAYIVMACVVMACVVMAYVVMAYVVMAYTGLGIFFGAIAPFFVLMPRKFAAIYTFSNLFTVARWRLYIGSISAIADGMSTARVWACRRRRRESADVVMSCSSRRPASGACF